MGDKAFLDTTILVDILLKPKHHGVVAASAVSSYERASVPTYALKELQLGALRAYVWFHNTLLTSDSMTATYGRLHGLSRSFNKNLGSTALEALREASAHSKALLRSATAAEQDRDQARLLRIATKGLIFRAWHKRSRVAEVVFPLKCYTQGAPVEDHRKSLSYGEACPKGSSCSLSAELRKRLNDVRSVREAILHLKSQRREDQKRTKALGEFLKRPQEAISHQNCRALGDAVFAILCPLDTAILTTNVADHRPLASALGKAVRTPTP
jgi:hypothetical protein